ncbi:hypothetical protein J8L98_20750 [Pseudoalteromonas sp. MMG013]|uniref:hypothetical protein n=1 Tax=Pseudoalteromonas sp. MMG013 TaxID=2822687 RepID=UPI001B35C5AA|nr:hypothetical protein [Pseudoalteromonas sp. MMG013]MBQ4864123.1 hypothetical protein [Pseudoalteromonas sp. MMG013]
MNLSNAIITSVIIVAAFWGLALFQGNNVAAQELNISPVTHTIELNKVTPIDNENDKITPDTIRIAGVHKHIQLINIGQLWQRFNQKSTLHQALKTTPKKVYVLYSAFSNNYQQADVVIGYDINNLSQFDKLYTVNTSHYNELLPAKKYTEIQLANAWKEIDYSKKVAYVLEVHALDLSGKTTSTQVFVSYN